MKKTLLFISIILASCKDPVVVEKLPNALDCADACERIGPKGLNCEEGKPIDMKSVCNESMPCGEGIDCVNGKCMASCIKFCKDTVLLGVNLTPKCIATVKSCEQINACTYKK